MKNWYVYKGNGDYFDSQNYRRIAKGAIPSCITGCKICAVLLKEKSLTPSKSFSNKLMQYMIEAIATGLPQPDEKPRVVLKNC